MLLSISCPGQHIWGRRIVIGLIVVALIIAIYQFIGVEMLGIGKAGHHHHPPPPPLHGGARPLNAERHPPRFS